MTVPYAAVSWRKSTRSSTSGGACVELANNFAAIRDSKNPEGPILAVGFSALLAAVKAGHLTR